MSNVIRYLADQEAVTVEVFASRASDGSPSYDSGVEVDVHVRRTDDWVEEPDGSRTATPLTL